jgi:HEAT repeat protein
MSLERLLQQLSDPSDLSWKDETYDLMDAKALSSADRSMYVAKLIEHAEKGDVLAIMTLGHLRANEALPTLEAAAKSGNAWAPSARRALVLLGKGASVLTRIADDAIHAPSKMQRVAAILDLPKIGGPIAIAALEQALLDTENDVRGIAWDALVDALGLAKRIANPEGSREITTDIEVMRVLLGSQISSLVKIGASGMQSVVRRLATGTTPQQLGIAWRPRTAEDVFENLRESMYEPDVPYKIDELSTLKGPERFLAETMIVLRLQNGDERVPDILVKLGAAWTVPALEELASSPATPSELQTKLANAARALASTASLN